MQFNARHVAALGNTKKPIVAAQTLIAVQFAKRVENWESQKESGVFTTSGGGLLQDALPHETVHVGESMRSVIT